MPNFADWTTRTLRDIAEVYDGPHATPHKTEQGPWFLSISSLQHGRLVLSESAHLSEDDFTRWTRRVTPQPNDVLFSYETRLGEAALMPDGVRACLGRRMAVLRPRSSEVNPRFLLYAYLGPEFQKEIDRRTVRGATVDRIPLNEIGEWPIRLPDRRTQDAIAEVLGALDEKIEANLRLAAKADNLWLALASSTIQSIEANEESNQSSDFRPLSSLAKFINGRAFTKDATGTGRMVVRIAELNSGPGDSTVYNDIDVSDEYVAQPGTLLFAWSGSLTVQRWFRPEAIINQHIFRVIPEPNVPIWLIHAHLLQLLPSYQRIAAGKATTMGHIQRRDLDAAVAVPDAETVVRLDTVCSPLWKRALRAETETLTLVALREVLLPKLLMGEIRVRVAEQSVGFAV